MTTSELSPAPPSSEATSTWTLRQVVVPTRTFTLMRIGFVIRDGVLMYSTGPRSMPSGIRTLPKLTVRVRFPSPAPHAKSVVTVASSRNPRLREMWSWGWVTPWCLGSHAGQRPSPRHRPSCLKRGWGSGRRGRPVRGFAPGWCGSG